MHHITCVRLGSNYTLFKKNKKVRLFDWKFSQMMEATTRIINLLYIMIFTYFSSNFSFLFNPSEKTKEWAETRVTKQSLKNVHIPKQLLLIYELLRFDSRIMLLLGPFSLPLPLHTIKQPLILVITHRTKTLRSSLLLRSYILPPPDTTSHLLLSHPLLHILLILSYHILWNTYQIFPTVMHQINQRLHFLPCCRVKNEQFLQTNISFELIPNNLLQLVLYPL